MEVPTFFMRMRAVKTSPGRTALLLGLFSTHWAACGGFGAQAGAALEEYNRTMPPIPANASKKIIRLALGLWFAPFLVIVANCLVNFLSIYTVYQRYLKALKLLVSLCFVYNAW